MYGITMLIFSIAISTHEKYFGQLNLDNSVWVQEVKIFQHRD